jgi:uncharacterized protein YjbJ (UPF0337 family)
MGSEERRPADFLTRLPFRKIAGHLGVNAASSCGFPDQSAKSGVDHRQLRRTDMDKDRVEGGSSAKGAVKGVVRKVTGDAKTQAEGAAEKAAGEVQNAVGGAKDAVRDSLKK